MFAKIVAPSRKIECNSNQSVNFHFKTFLGFFSSGYYALESGRNLTPPTL